MLFAVSFLNYLSSIIPLLSWSRTDYSVGDIATAYPVAIYE